MQRFLLFATTAAACLMPAAARAHYVWARLEPGSVRITLSEHPGDDAPGLATKIAATTAAANGSALELEKSADQLRATLPTSARVVEADCDYGEIERQGARYQLRYHAAAQSIPVDAGEAAADSVASDFPRLLWVGTDKAGEARLLALRGGRPIAGATVKLLPEDGPTREIVADEQGLLTAPGVERGVVAALLRVVDSPASAGSVEVRSYATLTVAPGLASADLLLERAHEARACWGPGFPGFSADIAVQGEGENVSGRLIVASDGSVEIDLPESPARDWAMGQLRSLVMHRGLNGPTVLEPGATFADEDETHPYGRLVTLADDRMGSRYRLDGDQIREVHREHRGRKFINRVLATTRNAEGKVLPEAYSVAYWDPSTDRLDRVETFHDRWTRVGHLDLPVEHVQVLVADGKSTVRRLVLSAHALTGSSTTSAAH